jgi:acyl-CoA thioester hydrolase
MLPFTTDAGTPIVFDDPSPFVDQRIVRPDEIDDQGHVNNAVYITWMDRAAFAHSCHVGYDGPAYLRLNATFVVRRHEVDYLASAFDGERILCATWPGRMERFTAVRRHQILRASDGQTLVRARTEWIYVDRDTGRPRRMPPEVIAAFSPRMDQA